LNGEDDRQEDEHDDLEGVVVHGFVEVFAVASPNPSADATAATHNAAVSEVVRP